MQPDRPYDPSTPPPPPPRNRSGSAASLGSASYGPLSPRLAPLSPIIEGNGRPPSRSESHSIVSPTRVAPPLPPRPDEEVKGSILRQAQITRLSGRMSQEAPKQDPNRQQGEETQSTGSNMTVAKSPTSSYSRKPSVMEIPNHHKLMGGAVWDEEMESIIKYNPPIALFPAHRDKVFRELFTTEATYVRNLRFVTKEFSETIEEFSPSREITGIFISMKQILNVNETLLKEFHLKIKEWTPETTISDAMQSLIPFLKMYTSYCASFYDAEKAISELAKQNSKFSQFLDGIKQKEGSNGLDLRSFLILPVQRIPRYLLLLQDFVKHTDPSHIDYDGLNQILSQVIVVANRVNEAIGEHQNRNRMLELHTLFYGQIEIVESHRRLMKEGALIKVCRKDDRRREFFLFNDMLLYGQLNSDGTIKLSQTIRMFELSVTDDPSEEYAGFVLNSSKKSFIVKASNQTDKNSWMTAINEQVAAYQNSISSRKDSISVDLAPVWKQDATAKGCKICSVLFSFTTRRHHCRKCGEVVCDNCSRNRYPISGAAVRVCNSCFQNIMSSPSTTPQSFAIPPLLSTGSSQSLSLSTSSASFN